MIRCTIHILLLMGILASCRLPKPKLQYENITINIPGGPGRLVKHQGQFYGYFCTDNDYFSTQVNQHFYSINERGEVRALTVPPELDTTGYKLFLQNDSIFIQGDDKPVTYWLDKNNGSWVAAKSLPAPLYEDDRFAVYAMDRGEWGGTTWFHDKRTNEQYELSAQNPVVTRYHNAYYLTTEKQILRVTDPLQLKRSTVKYDYHKGRLEKERYEDEPYSDKGATILYEGRKYLELIPKTVLITSFTTGNELYHLYEDSIGAAIGILRSGKLKAVHRFEPGMKLYRYYNSLEYPVQEKGKQQIGVSTNRDNHYRNIIIDSAGLKITCFKNNFREPVYDSVAIKNWVEKTFMEYYTAFGSLSLVDVDSREQEMKATNLTQHHKISHYLLEGYNIPTPRIYRKQLKSGERLLTSYYYTDKEKRVKLITMDWPGLRRSASRLSDDDRINKKQDIRYIYEWLAVWLRKQLGKPVSNEQSAEGASLNWKKGNRKVTLDYEWGNVTLSLY